MKDSKILIVEDDNLFVLVLKKLLVKKEGFKNKNVFLAKDGVEAIKMAKEEKFDLILMDVQMEKMDGLEATAIIRGINKHYQEVPILIITGFAMNGDKEKCLESGATDYLSKPVDNKFLIETIKFHLEKFLKK